MKPKRTRTRRWPVPYTVREIHWYTRYGIEEPFPWVFVLWPLLWLWGALKRPRAGVKSGPTAEDLTRTILPAIDGCPYITKGKERFIAECAAEAVLDIWPGPQPLTLREWEEFYADEGGPRA
jgi:hypothetical protein